jgi:phosphatidylglycerol lysyltransferase
MRSSRINQFGLWFVAILTAMVGLLNLLSVKMSSLVTLQDATTLDDIFPFHVRAGAHIFATISGFILLNLAVNLKRQKRVAWGLAIALLLASMVFHLVKGPDFIPSLLSALIVLLLVLMRDLFIADSDRPSVWRGIVTLAAALLFTLAYGTFGFYLLDRHYDQSFRLGEAIRQTLAMFFAEDQAGLEAKTRFGQFFADSIYLVGAGTLLYGVWMLFRPVLFRQPATKAERQRADAIVQVHGRSSLARFALLPDKSYYFSPSGQSVIAFVPRGRGAIALGDPIGPPEDIDAALAGFKHFCASKDWYPAFYQTLPDYIDQYIAQGFEVVQIGEEAVVKLSEFTLKGKAGSKLRTAKNKLTKAGYQVEFHYPPLATGLVKTLRQISDEWLQDMQGAEKRFSLGWFEDDYIRGCEVATVKTEAGQIVAFSNIIPEYQLNEATIDLMRHRPEAERGTMDFLFVAMMEHFKQQGYDGFNLGLVALSGVGDRPQDTP